MLYGRRVALLIGMLAVTVAGCTKPNPLDCSDGTCSDPAHPYCDKDGTVGGAPNTCIKPACSTPNEFVECKGDTAVSCNATEDGYNLMQCSTGCSAEAQGCSGSSTACTSDNQCTGGTPVCDVPDGFCVQCLQNAQCSGATPICDIAVHSCRACAVDGDCDSNVCDAATGMCVAEANVLYVTPTGPDSGTCTKSAPCSFLQAFTVSDQTRDNIKLAPGSYTAHFLLTNKTLVVFGVGASIAATGTNNVFQVQDNSRLRINGASLTATGDAAIRCQGTATAPHTLELFRATVDSATTPIVANPCTLMADQSTLHGATDAALEIVAPSVATFTRTRFEGRGTGIIALSTPTIQITNCVFKNMGTSANHGVFQGAGYSVSFSTFVDSMIECGAAGATGLTLNSAIVYWASAGAPADAIANQTSCTSVASSVIFPSSQPVGATNITMNPQLKNVSADDYHLLATSPAIDYGDPASTLAIDFDGVMRPQGAQRDSGAFEYKP